MSAQDDLLGRLGSSYFDPEMAPLAHAEVVRVARLLESADRPVVGFVPATIEVAVPPALLHIGLALTELVHTTVAVIDANIGHPGLALPAVEAAADGGGAEAGGTSVLTVRWLRNALAAIVPRQVAAVGAAVPQLRDAINANRECFGFMLVDLTGFEELGDHLNAIDHLDGVVLVGEAGRTREHDLLRLHADLPAAKNLGVLLV